MDPLSVAASVAGLISLAGQLVPALYNLGTSVNEASKDAQAAVTEVSGMSIVLQALEKYVAGRSIIRADRLRLITVEHISASLTACVLTYDELDLLLKDLHIESGFRTLEKAVWMLKREKVAELVKRIQNHKLTFTCMLNIIQCDSSNEAERNVDRLCDQVDALLKVNSELSARLRNLEVSTLKWPARRSIATLSQRTVTTDRHSVSSALSGGSARSGESSYTGPPPTEIQARFWAFEDQLHTSRPYRHAHGRHSASSLPDQRRSTLAISICSSLTLDEISNISVFALPIYATELSNASAYDFRPPVVQVVSPSSEPRQAPSSGRTALVNRAKPRTTAAYFREKLRRGLGPPKSAFQAEFEERLYASPVFGQPLASSMRHTNREITYDVSGTFVERSLVCLPTVVAVTGHLLRGWARSAEGLFQTASSSTRIRELQHVFEHLPDYGRGLMDYCWYFRQKYTAHDAANILLEFLLQLPEPIIPTAHYEKFCTPLQSQQSDSDSGGEDLKSRDLFGSLHEFDRTGACPQYEEAMAMLPQLNRDLLLYLLNMLACIESASVENGTEASMLASLFQPCLLSRPGDAEGDRELARDVVKFLIECSDYFYFCSFNPSGMPDYIRAASADIKPTDLPVDTTANCLVPGLNHANQGQRSTRQGTSLHDGAGSNVVLKTKDDGSDSDDYPEWI